MASKTTDVKLRFLIEAINKAGGDLQKVANDFNKIGTEADKAGTKTKKFGNESVTAINKTTQALDKMKASFERVGRAGDQLVSVGTQLGLMGAALSAAAIFPVAKAAQFEQSMSGVIAVTDGARENLDELSASALKWGLETKYSATEAADAMKFLGMAGLDAKQVMDAVGPSLDLQALFQISSKKS